MGLEIVASSVEIDTDSVMPFGVVGGVNTGIYNAWVEVYDVTGSGNCSVGVALVADSGSDIESKQMVVSDKFGTVEWYLGANVGIGTVVVRNVNARCLVTVKFGSRS